jgi:excinuclease ABC subunit B
MYADTITDSMRRAIDETERRRKIQMEYNKKHGIVPQTIKKKVHDVIEATKVAEQPAEYKKGHQAKKMTKKERMKLIENLEKEMKAAARELRFERAAELRDLILELKAEG